MTYILITSYRLPIQDDIGSQTRYESTLQSDEPVSGQDKDRTGKDRTSPVEALDAIRLCIAAGLLTAA